MASTLRVMWALASGCLLWALLQSSLPVQAVDVVAGSERQFGGHSYCLLTPSNWPDAEAFAVSFGGHLAVINDATENQWVWDTYSALMTSDFLWIGLFQPDGSPEPAGGWQWVDGTPLVYTAWGPNEPNNQGDEKCAMLFYSAEANGPAWNDGAASFWGSPQGVMEVQGDFPDVPPGHWAYDEIMACLRAGIVRGFPDGLYHPGESLKRSQMAVFIARALAGGDANVPIGPAQATFPDVPSTGFGEYGTQPYWAYHYIEYCAEQSIVQGYWDGSYHPEENVTRAQMAVYVARAVAGGDESVPEFTGAPMFADVPAEYWALRYVEYCAERGIVQGYWNGYHPEDVVTRDQMAVYIQRAFELPM